MKEESSEGGQGIKGGEILDSLLSKLSTLMNDKLAAPITKDELMWVWVAKNMAQHSAPCPDGFVMKFCTML